MTSNNPSPVQGAEKKIAAGICAIVVGGLGIHKFILGYTTQGVIMLLATVVGTFLTFGLSGLVMWIIALIEGISYLTKTDQDFVNTYVVNKKGWF